MGRSIKCTTRTQPCKNCCQNGWAGFIINGCIRDPAINKIDIGIKAINTMPIKSKKDTENMVKG